MLDKIKGLWNLMQAGKAVADPALWKSRQITVTALVAVLMAVVQLAKGFGYELPVDENTATAIAGGVLAVVNVVLTITTSDKVGFKSDESGTELPSLPKE